MAEDKYNILDPEDLMECPYNKTHMIRSKRLPYHLMKCRRDYTGLEFVNCPFNARHEIPKQEYRYHIANCPDKARIESDIAYEQQKNNPESQYYKGCTDMPSYKQADEDLPPPTENWDKECPTAIRIGVDPNYLYSSNKIVNTMGLAPSQKKQLSKYFMNKPTGNAEDCDGQTSIRNIIDSNRQGTGEAQQNDSETGDRVRQPRTTPALLQQVEKHRIAAQPPNLYAYSLSTAGVGRGRGRGITTPNAGLMNGLGAAANAGAVDNAQLMLAMSRGRGLMNYNTVSAPGGLNRAGAGSETQSLSGQDDQEIVKPQSVNVQDDMDSGSSTSEYDVEKEARKIRKKLRQIMMLEKRANAGEQLDASELAKVSKKTALTESLDELSMD